MENKNIENISGVDSSINLTFDESSVNMSLLSESNNSILDPEQSFIGQQDLYGSILPSPMKFEKNTLPLPKLNEKLTFPKQRKRSMSFDAKYHNGDAKSNDRKLRNHKRPSTCGKEGLRIFSTPLPQKIESINDSIIPSLTPETSLIKDDDKSFFESPINDKTKISSPLTVRYFSTPLADVRSNSIAKTAIQIKLHQLSAKEYTDEHERQLQRDILKYQSEINLMKKIKKYRDSKESENLEQLINKWKDIADKGSSYLYNEARLKISRMGGMEEFRERQKKSKLRKMKFEFDESLLYRIEEYMQTEEFQNLEKYEQGEIISKKKELEKISEKIESGEIFEDENNNNDKENEDSEEFTMKELYKQLGLDYDLVYGP